MPLARWALRTISRLGPIRAYSDVGPRPILPLNSLQQRALAAAIQAVTAGHTKFGLQIYKNDNSVTTALSLIPHLAPPKQNLAANRVIILTVGVRTAERIVLEAQARFPDRTVENDWKKEIKASGRADMRVCLFASSELPAYNVII